MSGPIVRSSPSPGFSKNWDSVFSKKKASPKSPAASPKKKAVESKKTKSKKTKKRGGK